MAPINLHLSSGRRFETNEGALSLLIPPLGLQIVVQDCLTAFKSEKGKMPADHLPIYFGVNIEHLCNLIFKRIELAGPLYFGFFRVGVTEVFGYSLPADPEASCNASVGEPEVLEPMDFKNKTPLYHRRSPN